MAADYTVRTRYEVEDASTATVRRLSRDSDALARSLGHTRAAFANLAQVAAVGAATVYGAWKAKKWLVDYNEDLQQAKIGMGALISTSLDFGKGATAAEKFTKSMEIAPGVIEKLKATASSGLGTFNDYLQGYQLLLNPIAKAGGGLDDVLRTTKLLVPMAQTLRIPMEFAAMDIQQMLMGMAKSTDRLPKFLGITAEESRKLAKTNPAELLNRIGTALAQWDPAAQKFGTTLSAQVDTLADSVKGLLGKVGEPVWQAANTIVAQISAELAGSSGGLDAWAKTTGRDLAKWLVGAFETARDFSRWVADHWERILAVAQQLLSTWLKIKAIQIGVSLGQAGLAGVSAVRGLAGAGGAAAGAGGAAGAAGGLAAFMMSPVYRKGADELDSMTRKMRAGGNNTRYWLGGGGQKGEIFTRLGGGANALVSAFGVVAAGLVGWELGKWLNSFGADDMVARMLAGMLGGKYVEASAESARIKAEEPARAALAAQKRLGWWLQTAAGVAQSGGKDLIRRENGQGVGPTSLINAADRLRRADEAFKGDQVRHWTTGMIGAVRSGAWKPKDQHEAERLFFTMQGAATNPEAFGLRPGEFTQDEAVNWLAKFAPALAAEMRGKPEAKGAISGAPTVEVKIQEVKIDARDQDPDDLLLVLSEAVVGAADFRLRSRVAPAFAR